jgi:hypothetical protein
MIVENTAYADPKGEVDEIDVENTVCLLVCKRRGCETGEGENSHVV